MFIWMPATRERSNREPKLVSYTYIWYLLGATLLHKWANKIEEIKLHFILLNFKFEYMKRMIQRPKTEPTFDIETWTFTQYNDGSCSTQNVDCWDFHCSIPLFLPFFSFIGELISKLTIWTTCCMQIIHLKYKFRIRN